MYDSYLEIVKYVEDRSHRDLLKALLDRYYGDARPEEMPLLGAALNAYMGTTLQSACGPLYDTLKEITRFPDTSDALHSSVHRAIGYLDPDGDGYKRYTRYIPRPVLPGTLDQFSAVQFEKCGRRNMTTLSKLSLNVQPGYVTTVRWSCNFDADVRTTFTTFVPPYLVTNIALPHTKAYTQRTFNLIHPLFFPDGGDCMFYFDMGKEISRSAQVRCVMFQRVQTA